MGSLHRDSGGWITHGVFPEVATSLANSLFISSILLWQTACLLDCSSKPAKDAVCNRGVTRGVTIHS